MRKGYTTGTCGQAAAKGACIMLVNHAFVGKVEVETPKSGRWELSLVDQKMGDGFARCAVVKDSGDDPDVTNGAKIYAEARYSAKKGVTIKGGKGVGRSEEHTSEL